MHDLRLCDPDWVLGINYLQEIADALHNFTDIFSNQWDVGVVGGNHRAMSEEQQSRPQVRRAAESSNELGQFASPIQSSASEMVRKLFFRPKQWTADMTTGETNRNPVPEVSLAVAIVRKMNLAAVLREGSYYTYEDEDDMINDAAQVFARNLHDAWWDSPPDCEASNTCRHPESGILIFLSVVDRVCFISTGPGIASVLPWWRLEHVVSNMKPDLRVRDYGSAILNAIEDLSNLCKLDHRLLRIDCTTLYRVLGL
ncbi:Pfam:TPM [Fragilaria crotonensis]|nr:Pfam:TPM [Fragilaria crotonensis]